MSDLRLKFTFKPSGADPRSWEVDLVDGVRVSEYIAMQKVSGIDGYDSLIAGITRTDPLALKALLWLLLKRDMSTVPWDTLDFTLGEVEVEDVELEPGALRAKLEALDAAGHLNELGRQKLAELIADGVELPSEEDGSDPKASKTDG